ncbi:MAG: aspartate/glutamate racemase family protein [Paracoccaceae bacterium]|nr:aspartate/glutamate racemase family protein [Paracoccaceae bacterium]MDE2675176.1 aspartate/glutamate racemase family protein [Paracoccaceae bacterium]MXZ51346.1 aspartate/glutamate racemase family protein [Paracoccaceae bacterium]MYF47020.1 aspartate/glutamate racemase family protein [Paracoccaceae bacterium]MYI92622.1 aspartate/glutamate racemase family protein [Paracoccaceae bacterium]
MKILVVNPNTTSKMTEKILESARKFAFPGTTISASNPIVGPESIQGYYDAAVCVPQIIELIKQEKDFDAVVISCFDDTGLDAIRCITDKPVIGIGEAAAIYAGRLACSFAIITTLSRSVPGIESNIYKYGLGSICKKVVASGIPVLELEKMDPVALDRINVTIHQLIRNFDIEAIVLGCAGMVDLANKLSREHNIPVIEGIGCGITLAQSMVKIGAKTSKSGGYAQPFKF